MIMPINAFVERFQGTVVHLHYRVAFCYPYYTSAAAIDADSRPSCASVTSSASTRGYRTRGRTPASVLVSVRPAFVPRPDGSMRQ
jgi:hypothetical protein